MSYTEPWRNPRPAPELDEFRSRVPPHSIIPAWLRAWWPALLWSLLIFTASTDTFSSAHTISVLEKILHFLSNSISEGRIEEINHIIRKCAHFTEYFVFYLLVYRGIRGMRRGWHWSWGIGALFLAATYSVLDEIHQSFVASRTASPWDSLLDSVGAFVALLVVFIFYRITRPTPPVASETIPS